ncbi:contractile injection system tape measure protein [Vibrio sp. AND4]|uniref:contractile injection system tape measure protein n=1 Tax=Vibrio sp. AND4 TaxID=314289 RepID=UPI00015F2BFC|nr:contractile injection system tape measure protein [Vibrio sp. AND4]EDP57968.1 hypothetical protein AND4_05339 [Vibrio sp. AND4]
MRSLGEIIPQQKYTIDKVRISLSLPTNDADRFSRRCSQLFHTELKRLLERVLSRIDTGGQTLRVTRPLIIDLGKIPAGTFEPTFCQQLERQLTRTLQQLVSKYENEDLSEQSRFDFVVESSEVLRNIEKLNELLRINPQLTLAKLAQACLEYRGANQLYRSLSPSKLKEICQKWVSELEVTGNLTPTTLQLCAIHYCQERLKLELPELDITDSPYSAYEKQILLKVFNNALDTKGNKHFKANWLIKLWQRDPVREYIQPQLSGRQFALLNKEMLNSAGNKAKDEPWESISNAGLSLLWPFLPSLFRQLGLLKDKAFLNRETQLKAASCISWLCEPQAEKRDYSPLPLLMCGITEAVPPEPMALEEETLSFLDNWLKGLPEALQGKWQKLSPEDIQQWFLQRPGFLTTVQQPVLTVTSDSFDVLLQDWPWPVNIIALPWLEQPIKVVWGSLE